MSSIEIIELEKRFLTPTSEVVALAPVNLTIGRGEFVVLLGPSGCGKTTLLRCIAGLIKPSAGSVRIATEGHIKPRIGVVFQDASLFPWMTIEDNVAISLQLSGVSKENRRKTARELCDLVGIGGFEKRWPRELSGGMRQRAAIARALAHNPDVLLMDEPFGALDAMTRDQLNLELQRIWLSRGLTVVLVTHSITEAVFLADRVVLMTPRPGRIECIESVDFQRPRDLDVVSLPEFQSRAKRLRHMLSETHA